MSHQPIFEVLILLGRPAAGKSEIRAYLQNTELPKRVERYHIGEMYVIDDFRMLWIWLEEDKILSERLGKPRLYSDEEEYFLYPYLWSLLIERIGFEYRKFSRDNPQNNHHMTTIIEFSRGSQHGGYALAFEHLSDEILEKAGVVYIQVSYEESLRKNRQRKNPERPDSTLEHSLEDDKMRYYYRHDDWTEFSEGNGEYLEVRGIQVPYMVFENEDDVTTNGGKALEKRLEETLGRLQELMERRNT
jgi:hypothetical protein